MMCAVSTSEPVQLFVERAAAVDPEFALDGAAVRGVVQIYRRLRRNQPGTRAAGSS